MKHWRLEGNNSFKLFKNSKFNFYIDKPHGMNIIKTTILARILLIIYKN